MRKERRKVRLLTAEQFARLDDDGNYRLELERGRVIQAPGPGEIHGSLIIRLGRFLDEFVERHGLGRVVADVGVITERGPDTVRGPDVAFTARARMNAYPQTGFLQTAPDLCVEILSPSNRTARMQQKVTEYLDAGARLVWVIDPARKIATEYRSKNDIRMLGPDDALEGLRCAAWISASAAPPLFFLTVVWTVRFHAETQTVKPNSPELNSGVV